MQRILILVSAAAILAAPAAQARPTRAPAPNQPSAAIKSRQAVLSGFGARMTRLDALMGVQPVAGARARSAEAGR